MIPEEFKYHQILKTNQCVIIKSALIMQKLMPQYIFIYIIWCCSLMVCKISSEVISGRNISKLLEEINVSKFQASALISHAPRILKYSKYHEVTNSNAYLNGGIHRNNHVDAKIDSADVFIFLKTMQVYNSDVYLNDGLQERDGHADVEIDNGNVSTFHKTMQPSFGTYILFSREETTSDQRSTQNEIRNIPANEEFSLQEVHLRYLMSSTAEQPDNSGRTSTFSMWLTILIAALAAAILS